MLRKSTFVSSLKPLLKGIPQEEQIQTLEKMKIWIDEVIQKKKKNRTYCSNCKKYPLTSKFKKTYSREVKHVTIHTDCGYGDDDTHGDVDYSVEYSVCPLCGHKREINKYRIAVLNEFDRWGNKIR